MLEYLRGFELYGFSKKAFQWILYRLKFNYPQFFNHKPVHLDLEISSICNMQCPFCYRQDNNFKQPKRKFIDYVFASHTLQTAYEQGMRSVKFNWRGEPTINPDLKFLALKAKQIGFLDIMVNTNGTFVFIKPMIDLFTEIRISLDTMIKKEYAVRRKPFELKDVLSKIGSTIENHDPKKTKIILQRRTDNKLEPDYKFERECKKIMEIYTNKFSYVKILSKKIQPRSDKHDMYNKSYYQAWEDGAIKRKYCKQPSQRLVVDTDGNMHACCLDYNSSKDNYLFLGNGNIPSIHLKFSINSEHRIKIINELKKNIFECEICKKCTSFTAYNV